MDGAGKDKSQGEIDIDALFAKVFDLADLPDKDTLKRVDKTAERIADADIINGAASYLNVSLTQERLGGILDIVGESNGVASNDQKQTSNAEVMERISGLETKALKIIGDMAEDEEVSISSEVAEQLSNKIKSLAERARKLLADSLKGERDEVSIVGFEALVGTTREELNSILNNPEALSFVLPFIHSMQEEVSALFDLNALSLPEIKDKLTDKITLDQFPEVAPVLLEACQELLDDAETILKLIESSQNTSLIDDSVTKFKSSVRSFTNLSASFHEGHEQTPYFIYRLFTFVQDKIDLAKESRLKQIREINQKVQRQRILTSDMGRAFSGSIEVKSKEDRKIEARPSIRLKANGAHVMKVES